MNKCLRRSLAWNAKVTPCDQQCGGQYLELPRAISDSHGNPHKGQKSYTTKWLSKRYKDSITNALPLNWTPDIVILEGMFLINTTPLCTHRCMKDYCTFLLRRFILSHLSSGSSEVHVVFDNPGRQPHSPIVHQGKNFLIHNLRIFGINTWLNISIDRAHYAQHDCALFRLMTRSGNVFLKYPHNFYKKKWVMMSFLHHRDRL